MVSRQNLIERRDVLQAEFERLQKQSIADLNHLKGRILEIDHVIELVPEGVAEGVAEGPQAGEEEASA